VPTNCDHTSGNDGWVNGNAGPENAHFVEGYSIPYRATISNIPAGANLVTVTIGWDIRNSGATAIDFLTSGDSARLNDPSHQDAFGHPPETFDDTVGTGVSGSAVNVLLQCPANATANAACLAIPTAERQLHLYGGNLTGGSCATPNTCGTVNGVEGDY